MEKSTKSTDCIEKCLQQQSYKIKFPKKKLSGCISLSPPAVELGVPKIWNFWNIIHAKGNGKSLEPLTSPLAEIEICAHWGFCRKFNFRQLLIEAFFQHNRYSAAFGLIVNLISHFSALFQKWQIFGAL